MGEYDLRQTVMPSMFQCNVEQHEKHTAYVKHTKTQYTSNLTWYKGKTLIIITAK